MPKALDCQNTLVLRSPIMVEYSEKFHPKTEYIGKFHRTGLCYSKNRGSIHWGRALEHLIVQEFVERPRGYFTLTDVENDVNREFPGEFSAEAVHAKLLELKFRGYLDFYS